MLEKIEEIQPQEIKRTITGQIRHTRVPPQFPQSKKNIWIHCEKRIKTKVKLYSKNLTLQLKGLKNWINQAKFFLKSVAFPS